MDQAQKGRLLLFALLPGVLVLDLLNGISEQFGVGGLGRFSPGQVGRGLLAAFGVVILLASRTTREAPLRHWTITFFAACSVPVLSVVLRAAGPGLGFELSQLLKLVYGPLLALCFVYVYQRFPVSTSDVFETIGLFGTVAAVGLIVPPVLGFGAATYGDYGTGTKGLFVAQNDVGLALGMALTCAVHTACMRPSRATILQPPIIAAAMLALGTRFGTVGAIAIPAATLVLHRQRFSDAATRSRLLLAGVLVLPVATWFFYAHIQRIAAQAYMLNKYRALLAGELTRGVLLDRAITHISDRPAWMNIFGEGMGTYRAGVDAGLGFVSADSIAEIDWIDVWGAYGLVGVATVSVFYIQATARVTLARATLGSEQRTTAALVLLVFLTHSALAGHAVRNALPLSVVAPLIALAYFPHGLSTSQAAVQSPGQIQL